MSKANFCCSRHRTDYLEWETAEFAYQCYMKDTLPDVADNHRRAVEEWRATPGAKRRHTWVVRVWTWASLTLVFGILTFLIGVTAMSLLSGALGWTTAILALLTLASLVTLIVTFCLDSGTVKPGMPPRRPRPPLPGDCASELVTRQNEAKRKADLEYQHRMAMYGTYMNQQRQQQQQRGK